MGRRQINQIRYKRRYQIFIFTEHRDATGRDSRLTPQE